MFEVQLSRVVFTTEPSSIFIVKEVNMQISDWCFVMNTSRQVSWLLWIVLVLFHGKLFAEFVYPTADKFETDTLNLAKFKPIQFHVLNAAKLESHSVSDIFDCTFFCVQNKKCVSLNIQVVPNKRQLLHCELLGDDMFHSPDKLQGNGTFHHFAVKAGVFIKVTFI